MGQVVPLREYSEELPAAVRAKEDRKVIKQEGEGERCLPEVQRTATEANHPVRPLPTAGVYNHEVVSQIRSGQSDFMERQVAVPRSSQLSPLTRRTGCAWGLTQGRNLQFMDQIPEGSSLELPSPVVAIAGTDPSPRGHASSGMRPDHCMFPVKERMRQRPAFTQTSITGGLPVRLATGSPVR